MIIWMINSPSAPSHQKGSTVLAGFGASGRRPQVSSQGETMKHSQFTLIL
jgi:hypothetical protein